MRSSRPTATNRLRPRPGELQDGIHRRIAGAGPTSLPVSAQATFGFSELMRMRLEPGVGLASRRQFQSWVGFFSPGWRLGITWVSYGWPSERSPAANSLQPHGPAGCRTGRPGSVKRERAS